MTKKEENQQNLSISFKLKLTKKPQAAWCNDVVKGQGLYSQLSQNNANKVTYNPGSFSLNEMQKAIGNFFTQRNQGQRQTKIHMNKAAEELFNKALMEELQKQIQKNEHRKKLSFRSKIFKQTYKFG